MTTRGRVLAAVIAGWAAMLPSSRSFAAAALEPTSATAFRDYWASGVPLNYIIDREGKIAAAWYGYEEGHKRALAVLEKLGVK